MKSLRSSASLGVLAALIASPAIAQDQSTDGAQAEERQGGVGTIVVTATKRSEDLQDVAISVNAIGEEALDELGIATFDDYLVQLPNVTAGGSGPGQSTIYVRGLASTTPNLTTAGVAGLAPNVALYLDEQPLAQPGRNLDVYAADLERIEVLAGPQGTLFGASSQAGVVRLITNKPDLTGFDAGFKVETSFTKNGETSYSGEAMLNLPVTDSFALRGVVYLDDQGGYIDNVAGTRTVAESARFRPAGTVRSNGIPVNALRGGFQAGADLSNVTFLAADNAGIVEEDFNDTQYAGFRISGRYEFNSDWNVTISHSRQSVESDGVFFADPELGGLGGLDVQQFEESTLEDDFSNTSWTVEGRIAMLDIVYTGAYTDRETNQRVDYSDYLFVGQYLPYYICDGSVTYPGAGGPTGTCQAPNLYVNSVSDTTVFTQELRFNTPAENRWRVTAGGFYSDLELKERNDFAYPGNVVAQPFGPFKPNFPQAGFNTDPGPFPADTIFRNDIRRTDKQFGLFGEASFDIVEDLLTVTVGARYYDIEVDFEGSANGSFCNSFSATDQNAFGTDISDLYDGDGQFTFIGSCNPALRQTFNLGDSLADIQAAGLSAGQAQQVFNALQAPDTAKTTGTIFKGTATLTPSEDLLFYATYSEGFRPGLLNRPGGATNGAGFTVPFELQTDEVKNYEIGWKLDLIDGQLRFNGSAFYVDISNLQTTIFDPSITNLFFSDNAANAEIKGIEGEFTIAPYSVPGLTVAGAFSFLDTEIKDVLTPTTDVIVGDNLAYAPSFQGNMRVRYEWDGANDLRFHIQPQMVHSSSKFTDIITINRLKLDGYTTFSLSAGVKKDEWSVELFGENLTDERAQIAGNFINDRPRITTNRPLTGGIRFSYDF
ncbi:TonB-dependent receptor [Parerythrobacter jejuensis]|uniref:TonB-dependent receptor plug domain-containing protein n=1 Tax=Parerythrobacter jejuensis TaxID=795812 RepID=A0A845AXI4_9SPHN|nr:TonB-dependent receptor [Parerythrobacter jejuensis]MXP31468.1 TonB-dependent receptor plug domain-containing protein [Parerythrobacter jejuensis]